MTNIEYYKEKILDIVSQGDSVGVDKETNKPEGCTFVGCRNCKLAGNCNAGLRTWCNEEYIEKAKLTENEKKLLDILMSDYQYIARDKNGKLYVYCLEKPKKDMGLNVWVGESCRIDTGVLNVVFDMVTWKDEEPWLVADLRKLEVEDEIN